MNRKAKDLIKSQMVLSRLSAADLHEELVKRGFKGKEQAIANRISRGNFSADFFLELLSIMGVSFEMISNKKGTYVSARIDS